MNDELPGDIAAGEKSPTRARTPRVAKKSVETEGGHEAAPAKPVKAPSKKTAKSKNRKKNLRRKAKAVEEQIGHVFANPALLTTALTHVSALRNPAERSGSYQRLEFLGDHVLGLVVSDMLFRAYPNADEGELSKRLSDLVRRETCAQVAEGMGLLEAVKLGAVGAGDASERLRRSVLGDICEAVIGAVFLDGGYPAAAKMIERAWGDRLRKPMRALRDAKTVLQEWAQGKGLPTPTYREVERTGPHHDPKFRVAVELPGMDAAEGLGSSKRAAEKAAALAFLRREGVPGINTDG
ncbi:ribonuclease III [Bradyrhizobium sp. LHD-71]|uniref:ribonuclease III n=1 Tax=Bradyrhizobium sp. LHD-71 TaxID=3072141 RepID=UPI00280E9BCE|nr:ribonuclease III [Bradyrhizobium sp. LHD-71]MDQ8726188.1 ribonuclease III [Bradyrhizobium sp. LHD-71]